MSTSRAFPSVHVRVYPSDYQLLAPGFRRIAALHARCIANGIRPIFYLDNMAPRPRQNSGRYDQAVMAAFLELSDRLALLFSSPCTYRQLQLSLLEIEFLMHAARVTRKQIAHGHIKKPRSYSSRLVVRLLAKLEVHRKRAKRLWMASSCKEAYTDVQRRWANLMRWIHHWLLYCTCHRQPPVGRRRTYRRYVDYTVIIAKEVLAREEMAIPEDRELRHLARLFLRSIRRERERTTIGCLLRGYTFAKDCLADFLICRIKKQIQTLPFKENENGAEA